MHLMRWFCKNRNTVSKIFTISKIFVIVPNNMSSEYYTRFILNSLAIFRHWTVFWNDFITHSSAHNSVKLLCSSARTWRFLHAYMFIKTFILPDTVHLFCRTTKQWSVTHPPKRSAVSLCWFMLTTLKRCPWNRDKKHHQFVGLFISWFSNYLHVSYNFHTFFTCNMS